VQRTVLLITNNFPLL